ncbi:MAG: phytanoyl-CoA dioxygenase family protein [Candidatus Rokubacteria bacterium]|nr:phytanoyl-CoA dioxygenase family protein [Candidatus Rokubacteria bacterium]
MTLHEFVPSNDLLDRPADLRGRMDRDGFLFLRGLLPRDEVVEVRRALLECCREGGWLVGGSELGEARVDAARACVEPEPAFLDVYYRVQRREAFHTFAHHPALLRVMATLLGEPPLPHPQKIARFIFPQNLDHTTPPHQDFVFIQGTPETYTAWIPLGDCPKALGGLQLDAGSHRGGILEYHASLGAGGMSIRPETLPDRWHSTDYRAGDVVVFHSLMVHRGLPNLTGDRLRLSVDYRYQAPSQPICETSLRPHMGELTWEEVYRGWQATAYRYYWKRLDLRIVPYDPRYVEKRDREAFELARQGNPVARAALLRIAQRNPDPSRRAEAQRALAELESRLPAQRGGAAR